MRCGNCRQGQYPILPSRDLLSQAALRERHRSLALRFRLSLDQVGETFGLSQVNPPILERTAGEFTRLRQVEAINLCQCPENRINDRAAAMALKFHDIFTGRTRRTVEAQNERIVQHIPIRLSQRADG